MSQERSTRPSLRSGFTTSIRSPYQRTAQCGALSAALRAKVWCVPAAGSTPTAGGGGTQTILGIMISSLPATGPSPGWFISARQLSLVCAGGSREPVHARCGRTLPQRPRRRTGLSRRSSLAGEWWFGGCPYGVTQLITAAAAREGCRRRGTGDRAACDSTRAWKPRGRKGWAGQRWSRTPARPLAPPRMLGPQRRQPLRE